MQRCVRPVLLALSCAVLTLAPLGRPAAAAGAFTSDQRHEVETIIHDYLLQHPEVMIEVLRAARDKLANDAKAKAQAALHARRHEVFDDPHTPVGGNPKGDVSIVEFFDYSCPYCKAVESSLEALLQHDRQLRFVYKEFPVLGPESTVAARAALAADRQGKYQAFHDAMMKAKGRLNNGLIYQTAKSVGLDVARLKEDMKSPAIERAIKANQDLADALDIHGTPGFVIGDEIVPGAVGLATLKGLVAKARKKG